MQANSITFNDSELHSVLINHTRYCLGRRSYAVGNCVDLLKSKWSQIPIDTQTIIRRDIEEAIRDDDKIIEMRNERLALSPNATPYFFPMDKCDRSSWDGMLAFIGLATNNTARALVDISNKSIVKTIISLILDVMNSDFRQAISTQCYGTTYFALLNDLHNIHADLNISLDFKSLIVCGRKIIDDLDPIIDENTNQFHKLIEYYIGDFPISKKKLPKVDPARTIPYHRGM